MGDNKNLNRTNLAMQEQLDRIESKLDLLINLLMDDDEEVQLPEGYSLEDGELGFDEPVSLWNYQC